MSRPVELVNNAVVNATGIVPFTARNGSGTVSKIPTRGHGRWAITTKKTVASAATVKLKGTNNPDAADTNGEDLITNTHAAADQQDGDAADVGYAYVFVQVTAITSGSFEAGDIKIHGVGFAGDY